MSDNGKQENPNTGIWTMVIAIVLSIICSMGAILVVEWIRIYGLDFLYGGR